MPLDFKLRTLGDHSFEFSLRRMGDRASVKPGLRPALEVIGDEMLDAERRLFESGGATGGQPWRPLKKSTRKAKLRKGQTKILVATGRLMESFTSKSSPDNYFRVTDIYVSISSAVPYAGFHQTGTVEMPARPPMMFTRLQEDHLYKILADFVFDGSLPK